MAKRLFSGAGAFIFLIFISRQSLSGEAVRPRGVRPELASFYDPARDFQCLDGSNTIGFDHVNDDYCDCQDGSDEPGTSACSNAQFYCPNRGYKPTLVFSTRVNDGICDCCDGSDEWALDSPCANTCDEMGAAEREERERQAKLAEEGLKVKAEFIQKGKELKAQHLADIEAKRVQKEAALAEKEAKKLIKDEAEIPEREALDLLRAEEERIAELKKEEQKREVEKLALQHFQRLDADQNGELSKEELTREIRFDQNNDGLINEDEATFYLSGHENYNKDTFLDIGWPLMSHLFIEKVTDDKVDSAESQASQNDGDVEDYDYDHEKDDLDGDSDVLGADDDVVTTTPAPPTSIESSGTEFDEATQALVDKANAARTEYESADQAYRDLEREVQDLEKVLDSDYGPEEEFSVLANQCFEYSDLEYTYKLCAFDSASQRPKNGGSETRLGNWERWSGNELEPYSQMSYTRGAQCWNGPTRSCKVNLKCGSTNQLTGVSEPSRCEYAFVFETPSACKTVAQHTHDHDEL